MQRIAILGSTGSVGEQALDLARRYPDEFQICGLLARGSRLEKLQQQAAEFSPAIVAVTDPNIQVPDNWMQGEDIFAAFIEALANKVDIFLNALDGIIGVEPSIIIIESGAKLALANKESMVCAGHIINSLAQDDQIWPVDSEHSALFQAAQAGKAHEIDRLVLTASGGPFFGKKSVELMNVTPAEAMKHPTWNMGELVSLNSATLINKSLELIEAHELFHIPYDRIEVTIHPQSIVHSMVTFRDGATMAQASPPSMLIPIAYALMQGKRLADVSVALNFLQAYTWNFYPLDDQAFPAVSVARQAGLRGGVYPAVFNAAAETAARGFLAGKIKFTEILSLTKNALDKVENDLAEHSAESSPALEQIRLSMKWSQTYVSQLVLGDSSF